MYSRNIYLDQLIKLKGTAPIKVITGVRRCGKSTLLDLFKEHLVKTGYSPKSIIHINFELDEFGNIKDHRELSAYIKRRLAGIASKKVVIMLDEIQLIPGWEKTVNSLRAGKRADLYITGSNATMLSSELAAQLSGRYIEIKMLPLSFREYLVFNNVQESEKREPYFERYISYGGFPGLHEMGEDENLIRAFLSGIYNTILMKDVVAKSQIRDTGLLERLTRFLTSSTGNIVSSKKISDYLTSGGRKTSHETIDAYLDSLEKAFFLYRVPRYDIKGKDLMKTLCKYYIVDTGLRYWSLGKKNADMGSILENIVYLELSRRGYGVFTGKIPKPRSGRHQRLEELEVDFIAQKDGITSYYQVTQSLGEQAVRDRETASLKAIDDNYEKTILSMDRTPFTDYEGIKQQNIIDWLLT